MIDYKKLPLLSVIIPTYNRSELIGETLQSVKNQTYQNWECIVVDDGSTDQTRELMKKWTTNDARFKFYKRHREPKGAPTCRNIGIEKAEGKYVIFLDSDDLLSDFCLERRVRLFEENQDMDFLVFQSAIFSQTIDDTNKYLNVENDESDLVRFFRTESLWAICGVIYKTDTLKLYTFNQQVSFWQDIEFTVRLIMDQRKYKKYLNMFHDAYIRQTAKSISRSVGLRSEINYLSEAVNMLISFNTYSKISNYVLAPREREALINFLYILVLQYLDEFKSHKLFLNFSFKITRNLHISFFRWLIAYLYGYILYYRKYSNYFIKVRTLYLKIFGNYIPDLNELHRNKIFQVTVARD